jgi:hypothetical protein
MIVIYQQIETYVLQPTIIGRAAQVSGFTVLASVLAFFGLIGAIIGVPIAAGLQIVAEELTAGRKARIAAADAAEQQQTVVVAGSAHRRPQLGLSGRIAELDELRMLLERPARLLDDRCLLLRPDERHDRQLRVSPARVVEELVDRARETLRPAAPRAIAATSMAARS